MIHGLKAVFLHSNHESTVWVCKLQLKRRRSWILSADFERFFLVLSCSNLFLNVTIRGFVGLRRLIHAVSLGILKVFRKILGFRDSEPKILRIRYESTSIGIRRCSWASGGKFLWFYLILVRRFDLSLRKSFNSILFLLILGWNSNKNW